MTPNKGNKEFTLAGKVLVVGDSLQRNFEGAEIFKVTKFIPNGMAEFTANPEDLNNPIKLFDYYSGFYVKSDSGQQLELTQADLDNAENGWHLV